jgi:hypothetical protein
VRRIALSLAVAFCGSMGAAVHSPAQVPGDANSDEVVDVADVVYELNYVYRNGGTPSCWECGDATGDCKIDLVDLVYLLEYLFKHGPDPELVPCGWSEPVNLGPPINSSAGDGSFRMSPDGRMAAWASNRPGTYGNDDIWYSNWDSVSGSWSEPQNCGPNVNWGADDEFPSFSPDGRKLYCLLFGRPGGYGNWNVWVSTWDSLSSGWGVIENLGLPVNTFGVWSPFLSPDGSKLYFSNEGIRVSEWDGSGWGEPVWLGHNVNANSFETDPTVTADNKTLYFNRFRWKDSWYICVSHWTGTEWGPAEALGPPIDVSGSELCPYITPDGLKLYFMTGRPGGLGSGDIWVSERIPLAQEKRLQEKK